MAPTLWAYDPSSFSSKKISRIKHTFHEHALMQMDELARAGHELMPSGQCRLQKANTKQDSKFLHDPAADHKSLDDTLANLHRPGAWLALYNVETLPRYRAFLQEVLDAAAPLWRHEQPGVFMVTGFIFLSGPPSVTPFHIDRENNFWLQVKGRKTINVWNRDDRDVVAADDVEKFILFRSLDNVRLHEQFRARSFELDAGPGDGVFFPSTSPHMTSTQRDWVTPGDDVSISIGVNFYSAVTRQRARVHSANAALRRLGMAPRSPGESAWRDRLKEPIGRAWIEARRRLRGYEPPPGVF